VIKVLPNCYQIIKPALYYRRPILSMIRAIRFAQIVSLMNFHTAKLTVLLFVSILSISTFAGTIKGKVTDAKTA